MQTSDLITYVGPPELHDGSIVSLEQSGNRATVVVRRYDGQFITMEFSGVTELKAIQAEGMMLYALAELTSNTSSNTSSCRFAFVNWDEESDAMLEIIAEHFRVLSGAEVSQVMRRT